MYHTSLELNSSNISLSYAQSNETQDLREACFELAMSLTNYEPGKVHTRLINTNTIITSVDSDLGSEASTSATTPKEDKKEQLKLDAVAAKILNPYFDETEEKKEVVDNLADNKKKFITHNNGLNVLFA